LLVYEQYLNDIEKESDPAHTNSNAIAKIKIKDSIAGFGVVVSSAPIPLSMYLPVAALSQPLSS